MMIPDNLLKGYENGILCDYKKPGDAPEIFPRTRAVPFDELSRSDIPGVLKANFHVGGKLYGVFTEQENHVGVIAATRLGKTTSYCVPTIIANAKRKTKRSMLISDPKGELYENCAATLIEEGYRVKLFNFRDCQHSECWNPLTPIFRKYQRAMTLESEVKTSETPNGVRLMFQGKTYDDQKKLDKDIENIHNMLISEVEAQVADLAQIISPVERTTDPYWEMSAATTLRGYIWAMLEDSIDPPEGYTKITENTFSFATLIKLITAADENYFSDRDKNSRAYINAVNTVINNGNTTKLCVLSTLHSKVSIFDDAAIRTITCCNSIELTDLLDDEHPTAIFIDYRDEIKTHHRLISLFIQQAYTHLIALAQKKPSRKLVHPFYFVLDEFGNFPAIKDMDSVISACGGRNIFFILILQSYAQLESVYGEATAAIIRDNLNVHVFFGSNNPGTLKMFSEECGNKTRISPISALNGDSPEITNFQTEVIPVMPVSALSNLKPGECIVTEANCGYALFSMLERYYMCDELKNLAKSAEEDYTGSANPYDDIYIYKFQTLHTFGRPRF